jgi:hypothetical protein
MTGERRANVPMKFFLPNALILPSHRRRNRTAPASSRERARLHPDALWPPPARPCRATRRRLHR